MTSIHKDTIKVSARPEITNISKLSIDLDTSTTIHVKGYGFWSNTPKLTMNTSTFDGFDTGEVVAPFFEKKQHEVLRAFVVPSSPCVYSQPLSSFDLFSYSSNLSTQFPAFSGIEVVPTVLSENELTLVVPPPVGDGTIDVIISNRSGYGRATTGSNQSTDQTARFDTKKQISSSGAIVVDTIDWTPDIISESLASWLNETNIGINTQTNTVTSWGEHFFAESNTTQQPTLTAINNITAVKFDGREDGTGDSLKTAVGNSPFLRGSSNEVILPGFAVYVAGVLKTADPFEFEIHGRGNLWNHRHPWMNTHAPWSDGHVYFDIGFPGGTCLDHSGDIINISGSSVAERQEQCDLVGGVFNTGTRISSQVLLENQITQSVVLGFKYDNIEQQMWINGSLESSNTHAFELKLNPTESSMGIGNTAPWHQRCDLGEVIIIDNIISQNIHEKIEGYLAHKWNLMDLLPSDHPYKTCKPIA